VDASDAAYHGQVHLVELESLGHHGHSGGRNRQAPCGILLGIDAEFPPPTVLPGYLGAGYAAPTAGAQAAFDALATTEAVFTDFVYSAKALHAVIDHAREDRRPVVFWHTGGVPALFSDTSGITAWLRNPAYSTGTETAQPQ
jgi:hypothetical protein